MHSMIGSFVLYSPLGSTSPSWPAVVCPDDIAPQEFLSKHPRMYGHLILLVGERLVFRWARTTEIYDYDPFVPFTDEEAVGNTPGLGEAFAMSNEALEAGLGLDHWRRRVRDELLALSSESDTVYVESGPETSEDSDDSDMRVAIEQSRKEFEKMNRSTLLTRSSSPPTCPYDNQKLVITVDSDDDSEEDNTHYPQLRSSTFKSTKTPPGDKHFQSFPQEKRLCRPPSIDQSRQAIPAVPDSGQATRFAPRTFSDGINFKRLGAMSNAPKSDTIAGDIEKSRTHVRVRVGRQQDERMLLRADVWNRPYFQDPNAGIQYFNEENDGMYELKHPGLIDIDPDDFTFIAEYLESGQLGHVNPQGADQANEAFSQIVAAWSVAEILGMTDLMEHLVDKLERLAPWDLWHAMIFARHVYASAGLSLPSQDRMKEMLAENIAENYWIFIDDDYLSTDFIQRLKELPELDRDVTVKRTSLLNSRLRQDVEAAIGPV